MKSPRQSLPAAIALGSNLGNSRQTLETALTRLAATPGIAVQAQSSWYRTLAVGPPQPDYVNACALLSVTLTPVELMARLLQLEAQLGRVRRERWGARVIDLDLLLFADRILDLPHLKIPHPRMRDRAFVLVPLAEIAADWVDPVTGQTIAALAAAVDPVGVQRL